MKNLELQLKRFQFTPNCTYGRLYANGEFQCYILEDTDRRLELGGKKIYGMTAIPRGRYEVIINYSNRFQKELPLLKDVPGFTGVRIHTGNSPRDTEGCLLPGLRIAPDKEWISSSGAAFRPLFEKIQKALKDKQSVFIEVT